MMREREACAGQPVSWLALERHALGELDAVRTAGVGEHLGGCAACRAALGVIEEDRRALPPLPDLWRAADARRRRRRARWSGAFALAAAAAALVLFWGHRGERAQRGPALAGVKGDEISLSLVRERGGDVAFDPSGFRPGDRFKVLVTCAADAPVAVDVTVAQAGGVDRPLPPRPIHCGNRVPLPGAFVVTGEGPVSICIAVGAATECRELAPE
jgi:hypothetical protein